MMKTINKILLTLFILINFSGCAFFNIGAEQGYCEENGCDYADAGVCGDVFQTFKTRYKNLGDSYKHIDCSKCNKAVPDEK